VSSWHIDAGSATDSSACLLLRPRSQLNQRLALSSTPRMRRLSSNSSTRLNGSLPNDVSDEQMEELERNLEFETWRRLQGQSMSFTCLGIGEEGILIVIFVDCPARVGLLHRQGARVGG
jgi:hypothetical protein